MDALHSLQDLRVNRAPRALLGEGRRSCEQLEHEDAKGPDVGPGVRAE